MSDASHAYIMAGPKSLAVRTIGLMRRKMYAEFLRLSAILPEETLLDAGVTGAHEYGPFNHLETWYPHKNRITAVGLDDASYLETAFPGITFMRANALALPFADNSFDIAYANAVIEHVGSEAQQEQFVRELCRVARRGVFFTTPNRWHPIEFHTVLPLVHWLPKRLFRRLLRHTRYDFYAAEANLNLLGRRDIMRLIPPHCSYRISSVQFFGWPSNLIVWIEKTGN